MPNVIESESATTDHANNRYPGVAIWIVVVGVAALVGLGLLLAGLLSIGTTRLLEALSYPSLGTDPYYYNGNGGSAGALSDSSSSKAPEVDAEAPLTYADGLSLYLSDYDDSLATLIGANDYAGAQMPVSNYVAALSTLDSATTTVLTIHMRTARARTEAGDEAGASVEISQALDGCRDTVDAFGEMAADIPADVTGPSAQEVGEDLREATGLLEERWQALGDALSEFGSEGATMGTFNDLLSQSSDNATRAAELLQEALAQSRNRS